MLHWDQFPSLVQALLTRTQQALRQTDEQIQQIRTAIDTAKAEQDARAKAQVIVRDSSPYNNIIVGDREQLPVPQSMPLMTATSPSTFTTYADMPTASLYKDVY